MEKKIEDFVQYLIVERGLSESTGKGYAGDLKGLSLFLEEAGLTSWNQVESDTLSAYIPVSYTHLGHRRRYPGADGFRLHRAEGRQP